MEEYEMCKYCNTVGCTKATFGEAPRKCEPPITQQDERVMKRARKNYTTSFNQSVASMDLSAFFRMELKPPRGMPRVDYACAPYAHYLHKAIGQNKVGLVASEWLQVAFCRLLVLRAAVDYAPRVDELIKYIRPDRLGPTFTLVDDFLVSFLDIVVDCERADLHRTEVHLMHAMLATQHDDEERLEDELVTALEHYEFEVYCNTKRFKVDRVMNLVRSIKRVVRVTGTLALLSPLHFNKDLRLKEVTALAAILYLGKIE